jgi:hypothetical protein
MQRFREPEGGSYHPPDLSCCLNRRLGILTRHLSTGIASLHRVHIEFSEVSVKRGETWHERAGEPCQYSEIVGPREANAVFLQERLEVFLGALLRVEDRGFQERLVSSDEKRRRAIVALGLIDPRLRHLLQRALSPRSARRG